MPHRRGRQSAKTFVDENGIMNAETATASGGSAVRMALRVTEKIIRDKNKKGAEEKKIFRPLSIVNY
jgi:uncharacterized protein YegL